MRGESSSSLPFPKPPGILYYSPNLLVSMYHLGEECLASTKKKYKNKKKAAHRPYGLKRRRLDLRLTWREALQSFAILHPKEEVKQ